MFFSLLFFLNNSYVGVSQWLVSLQAHGSVPADVPTNAPTRRIRKKCSGYLADSKLLRRRKCWDLAESVIS